MITLFNHQKSLLLRNPDRHALIWETGTGKTFGALSLANKKSKIILIICPKGLVDKWNEDIKNFPGPTYKVISKEQFKKFHKTLPWFECVVVDEAHYFFGTKSGLMKSLKWYFENHKVTYRYLLTGTPYRSTPMDIYMMCYLLGHKLNYWSFQNEFFYSVRMGTRMIPMVKKGIEPKIAEIVKSIGSIVKLDECIDMPESIFKEEYFELTEEQTKAVAELDDITPITRYTKIHQICGGTLKGDEYTEAKFFKSNKINRLIDLSDEIDKLIVVCRYNHEIEYVKEKLEATGKTIKVIQGATEDRHALLSELEKTDKYVLIVNASIAEGWQLQNCNHMVFYSYSFELKNYIQMIGRLRRIDRPRPVMYISLIVKGTIDEAVYQSIKNKESFHIEIYAKNQNIV